MLAKMSTKKLSKTKLIACGTDLGLRKTRKDFYIVARDLCKYMKYLAI